MQSKIELILFTADPSYARQAYLAGVRRVLVDLERRGKPARQHGYHLECNALTLDDVRAARAAFDGELIVRVNPPGPETEEEIGKALASGADGVMLPMFRSASEVERALAFLNGRATLIPLLETREAEGESAALARLPFDEIYVGLNDLGLATGRRFCWEALADGTVDRLREAFAGKKFGFGGVTAADRGSPIPSADLILEYARLGCHSVIARRAFKRDARECGLEKTVRGIQEAFRLALDRDPEEKERDRRGIWSKIERLAGNVTA